MRNKKLRFKKGAASFYIVAFSTLILLIVATSFAMVIISEIERTSNDDLSQSAYDSALAGVEDAKLAFYNYQNCIVQKNVADNPECQNIIGWMKEDGCYMVGKVLGRITDDTEGEVVLKEADRGDNNMQQAYTCVKVKTILDNYKSTLSSSTQTKTVKLRFADVAASKIKTVKVSWYADEDVSSYKYTNFDDGGSYPHFPQAGSTLAATPPTIAVGVVQTANSFTLDDFTSSHMTSNTTGTTDRGMVYLVPTKTSSYASDGGSNAVKTAQAGKYDYRGAYSSGENHIDATGMLWSNDKTVTNRNLPYAVYCDPNGGQDFACSATIDLPKPVNGERSNDTFLITVSLPYGKPTTSFMLEFGCETAVCSTETYVDENGINQTVNREVARLDGVQVEVDSTGRANDLYRRVETRLESASNDGNLSVLGPLELTDNSSAGSTGTSDESNSTLWKQLTVKCEYNFGQTCGL